MTLETVCLFAGFVLGIVTMVGYQQAKPIRRVDDKFHVRENKIIKTSTGEILPESEPTILFRGRDHLALPLLWHYVELCRQDGCNDFQLASMAKMVSKFERFKDENPSMMKQPGITRGKVYEPGKEYK